MKLKTWVLVSLLAGLGVAACQVKAAEFKPAIPVLDVVCTMPSETKVRPILEVDGVHVLYMGDNLLRFVAPPYVDSVYAIPDGVLCMMVPTQGDNNNNDGQ
jgi:hypothetical protein